MIRMVIHIGKKKLLFLILIFVALAGVLCYIGLGNDSPTRQNEKIGIYRTSLDPESTVIDFTDTETLGIYSEFYTHDFFRQMSLDMDVTVVGGKVYVVIYDVTDMPYTQKVSELTEVDRIEMEQSGAYSMDLKKLPENRRYVVGYFCDESCMFTLDDCFSWKTSMKEYIRDVWLAGIFKWEEQYTPKCFPENKGWDGDIE
ncbi:MAG: hypothetical protein K2L07_07545 [Lachnospiraceae bacterium]|nr:hypothetical protein [Lachnospiraceae bacterium]